MIRRRPTRARPPRPGPTLAAAIAALSIAQDALAQVDPTVRPTQRTRDCTTSGCHADTIDHKYLHGPTAVSDCRACHDDIDTAAHTFSMKIQGAELCAFCHIDKTGTEGPVVHKPLAEGLCLDCHDPHGSDHRKMLKFQSMGELCASCHEQSVHGATLHEPAAVGDCTACHSPHTADFPGLLVKDRRSLCLSCHESLAEHLATSLTTHEPVQGDCSECHLPHGSDHSALLLQDTVGMCTSCHEEQLAAATGATHPHSAVTEDRACLHCHTAHASSQPALQLDDPVGACLACHSGRHDGEPQPATRPDPGAPVFFNAAGQPSGQADAAPPPRAQAGRVSDLADHLPIAHGPVKDAQCGACHEVHGSRHSRLLIANYTENFYEPFDLHAYDLCLSCHDADLMLEDHTFEATRFRDGQRNMHALHVKGPDGEPGRTCRACHNTHASNHKAMVRDTSPYGQWSLPINFTPDQFGGSCAPGCHKAKTYIRSDAPEGYLIRLPDGSLPEPGDPEEPTDHPPDGGGS